MTGPPRLGLHQPPTTPPPQQRALPRSESPLREMRRQLQRASSPGGSAAARHAAQDLLFLPFDRELPLQPTSSPTCGDGARHAAQLQQDALRRAHASEGGGGAPVRAVRFAEPEVREFFRDSADAGGGGSRWGAGSSPLGAAAAAAAGGAAAKLLRLLGLSLGLGSPGSEAEPLSPRSPTSPRPSMGDGRPSPRSLTASHLLHGSPWAVTGGSGGASRPRLQRASDPPGGSSGGGSGTAPQLGGLAIIFADDVSCSSSSDLSGAHLAGDGAGTAAPARPFACGSPPPGASPGALFQPQAGTAAGGGAGGRAGAPPLKSALKKTSALLPPPPSLRDILAPHHQQRRHYQQPGFLGGLPLLYADECSRSASRGSDGTASSRDLEGFDIPHGFDPYGLVKEEPMSPVSFPGQGPGQPSLPVGRTGSRLRHTGPPPGAAGSAPGSPGSSAAPAAAAPAWLSPPSGENSPAKGPGEVAAPAPAPAPGQSLSLQLGLAGRSAVPATAAPAPAPAAAVAVAVGGPSLALPLEGAGAAWSLDAASTLRQAAAALQAAALPAAPQALGVAAAAAAAVCTAAAAAAVQVPSGHSQRAAGRDGPEAGCLAQPQPAAAGGPSPNATPTAAASAAVATVVAAQAARAAQMAAAASARAHSASRMRKPPNLEVAAGAAATDSDAAAASLKRSVPTFSEPGKAAVGEPGSPSSRQRGHLMPQAQAQAPGSPPARSLAPQLLGHDHGTLSAPNNSPKAAAGAPPLMLRPAQRVGSSALLNAAAALAAATGALNARRTGKSRSSGRLSAASYPSTSAGSGGGGPGSVPILPPHAPSLYCDVPERRGSGRASMVDPPRQAADAEWPPAGLDADVNGRRSQPHSPSSVQRLPGPGPRRGG